MKEGFPLEGRDHDPETLRALLSEVELRMEALQFERGVENLTAESSRETATLLAGEELDAYIKQLSEQTEDDIRRAGDYSGRLEELWRLQQSLRELLNELDQQSN